MIDYCRERNSPVDPRKFYEYFSAGDWKDAKGVPVRSWKQKIITWEKYDNSPKPKEGATVSRETTKEDVSRMERMLEQLRSK